MIDKKLNQWNSKFFNRLDEKIGIYQHTYNYSLSTISIENMTAKSWIKQNRNFSA